MIVVVVMVVVVVAVVVVVVVVVAALHQGHRFDFYRLCAVRRIHGSLEHTNGTLVLRN